MKQSKKQRNYLYHPQDTFNIHQKHSLHPKWPNSKEICLYLQNYAGTCLDINVTSYLNTKLWKTQQYKETKPSTDCHKIHCILWNKRIFYNSTFLRIYQNRINPRYRPSHLDDNQPQDCAHSKPAFLFSSISSTHFTPGRDFWTYPQGLHNDQASLKRGNVRSRPPTRRVREIHCHAKNVKRQNYWEIREDGEWQAADK